MLLIGCGGGDGETHIAPLRLECTPGGPVGVDQIGLDCPNEAHGAITVDMIIGGPSSSADIYAIKFDLVFDSTIVRFEAPALEGAFLNKDGGSTILQAALAPGDPNRLIVAISIVGVTSGVHASSVHELVLRLLFSALDRGTSVLDLENAEAVDSSLLPISDITFVGPLTITVN